MEEKRMKNARHIARLILIVCLVLTLFPLFQPNYVATATPNSSTFYSTSSDGYISNQSTIYTEIWEADGGTTTNTTSTLIIGQQKINEGDYTGDQWNTETGHIFCSGVTQNGTYFWIVDYYTAEVFIYHMNGTYTGDHWDTAGSGNTDPYGVTQNGTYIWIVENAGAEVYKYHMNGTYTTDHWDTAGIGSDDPESITQNGTYFWITDATDDLVYKYHMNGTYTTDYFDLSGSGSVHASGITQNGTYFWISEWFTYEVYKYYINGTYTGEYWDTSNSGNGNPRGITQNGTYFWIADRIDNAVYKYYMAESSTIYRSAVYFDSSSLPDNAVVSSATLSLYGEADNSTTDFNITIQNGQPTYPHDPLESSDFAKGNYTGTNDYFDTADFSTSEYNIITLTNMSWINITGTTKFCLRSSRDISGTEPTTDEFVSFWSNEKGEGYKPKLIVTYLIPPFVPPPKPKPNAPSEAEPFMTTEQKLGALFILIILVTIAFYKTEKRRK